MSGNEHVSDLLDNLLKSSLAMQIIGPHGVGKTTLAHSLRSEAESRGLTAQLLRGGRVPKGILRNALSTSGSINIVDEFAQLSRWQQTKACRLAQKHGSRLVVITHHRLDVPILTALEPDLEAMQNVVSQLQQQHGIAPLVTDEDVSRLMLVHQQNCREVLFHCYDLFHQRHK